MKKAFLILVALGALGGGYAYYRYQQRPPEPTVMTAVVGRGDVAETVGATGTLQAVTTVQVGTQVSGIVQDLYADFNTLVKKGQVIARLDPSVIQTQIEQARANLIRAEADLERLKVNLDDTRNKLTRARELSARSLIPPTELETAQVNVRSAEAQIRSAEASITQSRASLRQNEVNLEHTIITAPIDGLVISRNVDRGQTVAASMQAPTLFVLAADLTKMQVVANLDESDVGRIRPGQRVSFRVDAYPADEFHGTVTQVRLQPILQQNVVTYATVIDVPNPQLKLKPGMTANVNVEIARRNDVVRVPNAALRFRPTNEIFAALGQTPPEQNQRVDMAGPRGRGVEAAGGRPAPAEGGRAAGPKAASTDQPPVRPSPGRSAAPENSAERRPAPGRGSVDSERQNEAGIADDGGGRGRGGFGGRGRGQNLTPEQRQRMQQRLAGRGLDSSGEPGSGRRAPGGGTDRSAAGTQAEAALVDRNPNATTIDALFGPLPAQESVGRIWVYSDKLLRAVGLRLGISDGQATELLEGDLEPGMEVVTNVTTGAETRPSIQGGFPPFTGPGGGRGGFGGPGGGRGGGGGGRGGG